MKSMNLSRRIRAVREVMHSSGIEALLLMHAPDVRYLSGFTGSNAVLLFLPLGVVLFTDSRYTTQAREETAGSRIRIRIGKQIVREACAMALDAGVATVHYDAEHTSVATLSRMEEALPEGTSRAERRRSFAAIKTPLVASQREIKDTDELALLEEAASLGCSLFYQILSFLKPGVTEREVAAQLEFLARSGGADGMSFDTIVASGPRSALPHGHASEAKLPRRGFVTLDFGVMLRGYCSDMTRTVYLGKPGREEREAYAAVLLAQESGVSAVRAGVSAGDVDDAARKVLRQHGLAKFFIHSTGHGLGLEIHEGPRLGANVQQPLAEGMVVTVEPGVYLPGRFGIRIEDTVVVEAAGCRILTTTPKDLLTL